MVTYFHNFENQWLEQYICRFSLKFILFIRLIISQVFSIQNLGNVFSDEGKGLIIVRPGNCYKKKIYL